MARAWRHRNYIKARGDEVDCDGWLRRLYIRRETRWTPVGLVCDACGASTLELDALGIGEGVTGPRSQPLGTRTKSPSPPPRRSRKRRRRR